MDLLMTGKKRASNGLLMFPKTKQQMNGVKVSAVIYHISNYFILYIYLYFHSICVFSSLPGCLFNPFLSGEMKRPNSIL